MKIIVVSYSLPVRMGKANGEITYTKECCGLVTGLENLSSRVKFVWVGSSGDAEFTKDEENEASAVCLEQYNSVPVFLPATLCETYLHEFCDEILWPTLHSFPDDGCFIYNGYEAYKEANRIFAEAVLEKAEDGDIIWIHDYQLMLLPAMLKKRNSGLRVIFFLHIAFPNPSGMERLLCKDELLRGVCASDVASFHIPEYVLNFRRAVEHIPSNAIIKAISIGTDPELLRRVLERPETQKRIQELKERFKGKRIVLGVDRLDYMKGIPHKIKGFGRLLKMHPEMEGSVVLVQIGVPNRLGVRESESYVSKVGELVTEINGRVGDVGCTVVHMLNKSVSITELVALYAVSDVLLVTSLFDGLNLVALEYTAIKSENNPGVIVLSKFAGAATMLQGAVIHNPYNTEEIAKSLEHALSLSLGDRVVRYKKNVRNVEIFTSMRWVEDNLSSVYPEWRVKLNLDG